MNPNNQEQNLIDPGKSLTTRFSEALRKTITRMQRSCTFGTRELVCENAEGERRTLTDHNEHLRRVNWGDKIEKDLNIP